MPGDESITKLDEGLTLNDKCLYKSYNDPTNLNSLEYGEDTPMCGFNSLGSAYCPMRKGDSYYKEFTKIASSLFQSSINCNANSNGMCKGILD